VKCICLPSLLSHIRMDHSRDSDTGQQPHVQKFSRYRSVRKAASKNAESHHVPLPTATVSRTPSRYHRKPQPASDSSPVPSLSSHPPFSVERCDAIDTSANARPDRELHDALNGRNPVLQTSLVRPQAQRDFDARNLEAPAKVLRAGVDERRRGTDASPTTLRTPRRSYEAAREEALRILEGETDRRQNLKVRPETDRHPGPTRFPTLRRHQGPGPDTNPQPLPHPINTSQDTEDLEQRALHAPETAAIKPHTLVVRGLRSQTQKRLNEGEGRTVQSHGRSESGRGQGHAVAEPENADHSASPLATAVFDAPISAINAGDRRVHVKVDESLITLPVKPLSTAQDLLDSASACLPQNMDPRTAVLLESFSQLGLERPLRRYERIRDVMNSWDDDIHNHLVIMSAADCLASGLDLQDAPRKRPDDGAAAVQIYHSQKPGKWDQRWIHLREDGQMTISRRESGTDSTNICHLSDYDLYTPSPKQMKKLKPPKKICFALKSQEKSAMFLNTANFVHFFCTKDKAVANRWYQAVQTWRSWYLVHVLGEGESRSMADSGQVVDAVRPRPHAPDSKEPEPHELRSFKPSLDLGSTRSSIDTGPMRQRALSSSYHGPLGSTKPLLDFTEEENGIGPRPKSLKRPSKLPSSPPSSFPRRAAPGSGHSNHMKEEDTNPFTGVGLLARSASKRSQGGRGSGRGVRGVEGKPLVDLHPTSEFTDGSYLRQLEIQTAQQGILGPKIDREKRIEANVDIGEGFG